MPPRTTPVFHLTQPSRDARLSPELAPSAAFLSTSDLPAPAVQRSRSKSNPRQSSQSPDGSGGGRSGSSRRRTSGGSLWERPLTGRHRSLSSSSYSASSSGALDTSSVRSHGLCADLSLRRPSSLALPGSLALFAFAVVRVALDWRAAADYERALDLDFTSHAAFDIAANMPRLGWRSAAEGEWWSAGSEPSPWDYRTSRPNEMTGRGDQGRVRVLFLTDFDDHLERMNTAMVELISAAFAHPKVETDVWGPKWAGWNADRTISQNMAVRRVPVGEGGSGLKEAGPGFYDLVWTISDIFPVDSPALDNPGHGTLFAQQLGDCHSEDCVSKWYAPVLNITTTKYPSELGDLFSYELIRRSFPEFDMHLFGHSLDGANRWDFYPLPSWDDKKVALRGYGFDGSFYPIRTTVTDAVKAGKTPIEWYSHPGYSIPKADDVVAPERYELGSPLHDRHRAQRVAFASALRETKICVFDSSLERKLIRKWAQAMLSGCVIASDVPTDREEDLLEFMIELKQGWSIETINGVLAAALANEAGLKRKAQLGFAYARAHLTNDRKVDGMLQLWQGYLQGWRGYHHETGFSLRCRQYWSGDDAFRPPWCAASGLHGFEGAWDRAQVSTNGS